MLPTHIGFIMDGNGRWATKRGKPRNFGHKKGSEVLEKLCNYAFSKGVKVMSFYAFSTENWSRSNDEVSRLMALLRIMLKKYLPKFIKEEIRLVVSGDIYSVKVSEKGRKAILDAVEKTKNFKERVCNICFNYGSRNEIVNAVNKLVERGEKVNEETFSKYLYTSDLPDVDLIIRTSGEQRLSNFLLWQSAYAELYFTDVLWPDYTEQELQKALDWFDGRKRRFGGV